MSDNHLTFSCEFFPPKTEEGLDKLLKVQGELSRLNPEFYSVTFGAGGTTRERTLDTVLKLKQKSGVEGAPHLSCIGSSRENLSEILQTYQDNGISRLVALRGDMPSGMREPGELNYANELVSFIREQTGDHFHIEVAAYPEFHPQAKSARDDLDNFKRKVDAGANSAITQYFYNPDAYIRFVESCQQLNIDTPIVPGIMPINNYVQLARFSDACGAEIPRWLRKRLESYGDDLDSIRAYGIEVVSRMCQQLLDAGAPGLHFYTMNQSSAVLAIWNNINLGK